MIHLGIDVGGSTTKIVGINGGVRTGVLQVRAADQITSLYGAVGRFLQEHSATLADVGDISLTGVGASFFGSDIYGIPVRRVDEFTAIGRGALELSGLSRAIVVSIGTGSAFVKATPDGVTRVGGSGVGGGTLLGLSRLLLHEEDVGRVSELAMKGDPGNVDLLVGAISAEDIPSLPKNATAANFGAVNPTTRRADVALGITNLVAQTVGMLAVFAVRNDPDGINDAVIVGSVAQMPQCSEVLHSITEMTGVNFIIPPDAAFATALGAANG
jgi:type II pantothenate kinase